MTDRQTERKKEKEVSWCVEPSQPERITSGLKKERKREKKINVFYRPYVRHSFVTTAQA